MYVHNLDRIKYKSFTNYKYFIGLISIIYIFLKIKIDLYQLSRILGSILQGTMGTFEQQDTCEQRLFYQINIENCK